MKIDPKSPNRTYLVLLVVALFVTAGLVFSRVVDFSQFMHALTGSLTNAERYNPGAVLGTGSEPTDNNVGPAVLTGTLTVIATPDRAKFDILDASTNAIAFADKTGAEPLVVPVGNYRVVFKPMAGYDTPLEISTEVKLRTPAKVSATYLAWPACAESDWDCTKFYPCDPTTQQHTRICVLKNPRCSNGDAVQPALSEKCVP